MGDYDSLHGRCPSCGTEIEEQTKAFLPQYKHIEIGDFVTDCNVTSTIHTFCVELSDCYECKSTLYANFRNKQFIGFTIIEAYPVDYSDKSRRLEIEESLPALVKSLKMET